VGALGPGFLPPQGLKGMDFASIQQSIASTPGNCPCPFNTAANGSRCGKRSSYSRGGGYSPICYPEDVTPEMLARYRSNGG